MAGVGIVGTFASLATVGSIQAFSRDMEREADQLGFEMMARAGYDSREAPKIWEMMIAEKEASNRPKGSVFFASHPTSQERRDTLTKMAAEYDSDTAKLGRERFVEMTARYRGDWLRDELRQRDFGSLQVVLDYLMEAGANHGELQYFQGELHRLRGEEEEDDAAKAVEAYEAAIDTGGGPPEAHRALGLVYWSAGRKDDARGAFEAYIEVAPEADDRAMVEYYLQQFE